MDEFGTIQLTNKNTLMLFDLTRLGLIKSNYLWHLFKDFKIKKNARLSHWML